MPTKFARNCSKENKKSTLASAGKEYILTTLEFLKSINDGESHKFKDTDMGRALHGENPEFNKIKELKERGLVEYAGALIHGRPSLGSYWITDKGIDYIKDHSKKHKFGL